MKFTQDQVVVALSHMDDDYAYVFGVAPYQDYLRPAVELPWNDDESGCIIIRETDNTATIVWEMQSQFFTKDDFRKFIGDRKIKRVALDEEARVPNMPSVVNTFTMQHLQQQMIMALVNTYIKLWQEVGHDASDPEKYEIKDDGRNLILVEVATGKVIPDTDKIRGFLEAFYTYAEQERENIMNVHRFHKQSLRNAAEAESKETEEVMNP